MKEDDKRGSKSPKKLIVIIIINYEYSEGWGKSNAKRMAVCQWQNVRFNVQI
jgi:hypothetical protein